MKIKLTIGLIFAVIENIFFFTALGLGFLADWKVGLAMLLYEIARACESAREFKKHRGQLQSYIKQVLTEMFVTAKEELRGKNKNDKGKCRGYERLKLYVSGLITGDANYQEKFLKAENTLREAGFEPVNPAARVPPDRDWSQAMRVVAGLMLECDGVALLPDWEESRGAKIEARLAREVGIPVKPVGEWIAEVGE
jgi:hypothetical protein